MKISLNIALLCGILAFSSHIYGLSETTRFENEAFLSQRGSIDETFNADSELYIVHIKDAHCNPEAQLNSAAIIQSLVENQGFSLICMEGASNPLDLSDLVSFPDEAIRAQVSRYFLENGNINGVEYLSLVTPNVIHVEGIEDKQLYRKNYFAFYKSLSFRKKAITMVDKMIEYFDSIKPFYYSEVLLNLDSAHKDFSDGSLTLLEFFSSVQTITDSSTLHDDVCSNIAILNQAAQLKKSISFVQAEKEKDAILRICLQYAGPIEKENIIQTNARYTFGHISTDELYTFMEKKCDEYLIELEDYPNFSGSIRLSKLLLKLDNNSLIQDVNAWVTSIKNNIDSSEDARRIDKWYSMLLTIRQGCRLTLPQHSTSNLISMHETFQTDELWNFIQTSGKKFNIACNFQKYDIEFVNSIMSYVCEFYSLAEQRNHQIIENTLRMMRTKGVDRCVLYTGGFHTEGLTAILRSENIAYSVITPFLGKNHDEDPYYYLLSNHKNPFLRSLEQAVFNIQQTQSDTLALESKLVPPTEVMLDPAGVRAFRDQLKTFYLAGGIRKALEDRKAVLFPLVTPLDEQQLSQLSDKIKALLQWRLQHFTDVSSLSLVRNSSGNIDLQIAINNQTYYVRDLIVGSHSARPVSKLYLNQPEHLVTVNIGDEPFAIFATPSTGKDITTVTGSVTDEDIATIINHFIDQPSYTPAELIRLLALDIDNPESIISTLTENKILTIETNGNYALNPLRADSLRFAAKLSASKAESWNTVIASMPESFFPAPFADFLNTEKISELIVPGSISFPALLYMVETLPAYFTGTAVFPANSTENFLFKKEKIIGSDTFRLSIDILDNNYTTTVMQERNILMGNDYATTIQQQLFGAVPQIQQEIILKTLPYSPTIILNSPTGQDQSIQPYSAESPQPSITWLNPDQTTLFWRQIMECSMQFDENTFNVTGGLLFGKKVGSNYIVSDIIPFSKDDIEYQDDEIFQIKQNRMDDLIDQHATADTVLLGIYRNHSPRRLVQNSQPGVDRRDSLDIYPFNQPNKNVVDTPIGLVFEPILTHEQIGLSQGQQLISNIHISPSEVDAYFYTQIDGQPQVIHREPALSCAMPGELLIADTQRSLYLRRIKETTETTETAEKEVASFRRLPKNQGFVLLVDPAITQEDVSFFVQFFRSIQQDVELLSDIKEISIRSGMRRAAHVNRNDKIIEFNIDMLNYPKLIQYIALPHEWNHLQLDYKEEIEEILVVMLDLNRINELAFRDHDEAMKVYQSLAEYEDPYQGNQLFTQVIKQIIDNVQSANRTLAPLEIFNYTRKFILSDPDLKQLVGKALSEVEGSYFVSRLRHILGKDVKDEIPSVLPGSNDYIVFEEQALGAGHAIHSNIIDFSRLRVRYLSSESFKDQAEHLSKLTDLAFMDNIGYFDPRKKEIGVNIGNPFHLNDDGSINHDLVLSTIIHQRTHYLLHQNKGILTRIRTVMEQRTDLKDALITYFFAFKNFAAFKEGEVLEDLRKDIDQHAQPPEDGKPAAKTPPSLAEIRKKQMESLINSPAYAPNGQIDIEKILNEVICNSNAYSSIIYMLHKYEDIAKKFETANQPVPPAVQERISDLKKFIYAPEQVLLLKMAENARNAMIAIDKDIESAFRIPQQSTLHVFTKDYGTDQLAGVDITAVETTAPINQEPVVAETSELYLSAEPVSFKQTNAFLTAVRTYKNQAPPIPIQYTKELAQQNALEFYEFLRDKQRRDPLTALPESISIVDLYLGSAGYAKDFLDHLKKIDAQNLFYKRLRYHIASHSISSQYLLKQLESSNLLVNHSDVIQFHYLDQLPAASAITTDALLVRSFGDITLFDDVAVIEKDDEDYYLINGQLKLDKSLADTIDRAQWFSYLENPSSLTPQTGKSLPDNVLNAIGWHEARSLIDIDGFSYGYFVRSYSEHHPTNRYIFHPQLLKLAQQSLSNMALNFGGYWQINGNSFSSIDKRLDQPENATVELDSVFLAGMMQSQGGFLLESQRRYLERRMKQKAVSTVIDELRLLDAPSLSDLIPAVTFADLNDSARIYNTRQELTYRSSDQITYSRFIRDLKNLGYIPQQIGMELNADPTGMDDFLHSLTRALSLSIDLEKLSKLLIDRANDPDIVSQKDLIEQIMKQPFIQENMISMDYIKKALDIVYTLGQNRRNFHVRAEVTAPERVSIEQEATSAVQPRERSYVKIRNMTQSEFDAYIDEIHRDYPLLDFGDARGIANPITGEIVINNDHHAHKDENGEPNIAEIRQTIVHEKAHMLIFARWDELKDIADELKDRSYERKELIKLFYEFYFDEKISLVNNDHFERLRTDPLWSENGQISYERILSELLAVINQYQMLPTLLKRFKSVQSQMSMRGKAVPPSLEKGQMHIADIYRNKRGLITSTVSARTILSRIDSRISKNFLFNASTLELPVMMTELEQVALPLPSTPIKTVFSNDELNEAIYRTWDTLGNGNPQQGQAITRLKGLPLSDFNAAIERLADRLKDIPDSLRPQIEKIIVYYRTALEKNSIHLYPTSPESYTIQGSHFTHLTDNGQLIIAEGYFQTLRSTGDIDKALAVLGAQLTGVPVSTVDEIFDGSVSIESIQKDLFDKFVKTKDYMPVIEAILNLNGIRITNISRQALQTIIDRHSDVLQLPGMKTHLENIQRIMSDRAILSYHKSPVAEAFSLYAQSLLSAADIENLRDAVLDISSIVLRETSAPVIFLIDYKSLTGGLSPQNFAIRDSLNRIRKEIEMLEKRNVVIVAVDLEGTSVGAVKKSLDIGLLRKGATSEDFDFVVSYDKSDDLLSAIENEYHAFPADILKNNIKVLAFEDSRLLTFAKQKGFAFQALQEQHPEMFVNSQRNVFLIDYLRSLGLTSFLFEDGASELSKDLRASLHITAIHPNIDTTGIPEHLLPVIDRFIKHIDESPADFRFNDLLESFYVHAPDVRPNEWGFLSAYLQEQYSVSQLNKVFEQLAQQPQERLDALYLLYQKLQATRANLAQRVTPTYQTLIDQFFMGMPLSDQKMLRSHAAVTNDIASRSLTTSPVVQENMPQIFLSLLLDTKSLSDSEYFVLERKITTDNSVKPVTYQRLISELHARGIDTQISPDRYFQVEIAPRRIQSGLKELIATQKLFDESA